MGELNLNAGKGFLSEGPSLDREIFDHLRQRITTASGIYVPSDESSRFVIERRLRPRLRARGALSFSDYISTLDAEEMEQMLDAVAIHETYFFRERRQLSIFSEHILPELEARGGTVKILSAGCSTGEEAYTIAMLLAERGLFEAARAEVIASDLSRRVIEIGKRGIYGASSFRTTNSFYKRKYFATTDANLWQANDALREAIHFEQLNLINLDGRAGGVSGQNDGNYDVIFCRNVLMYFDSEAVKKTLNSFYSLLNDGGYILLGHAESLLPMETSFKPVQLGREYVHRK